MNDRKINSHISYRLTQLANGMVRIDGEVTLGQDPMRTVVLMLDPARCIKRLLLKANCNSRRKTLAMGGALCLSVIGEVEG